jgi:uncharacterized protein YbcI
MPTIEGRVDGSLSMAVSDLIVRLVHKHTGRGPTHAKTIIAGDVIFTVLRDTLTHGERTLVEHGKRDVVLDMRRAFQSAMRDDAEAGLEELTGRKVMAFLSDNCADPDLAIEAFVLEPTTLGEDLVDPMGNSVDSHSRLPPRRPPVPDRPTWKMPIESPLETVPSRH